MRVTTPCYSLIEKTKLNKAMKRSKGIKLPFGGEVVNGPEEVVALKEREHFAPVKSDYVPCKVRGRSGTRLNQATRSRLVARVAARDEFLKALRG